MSNKFKLTIGAAIVLLFLSLIAVFTVSGQSSRERDKDADIQWEYLVVTGGSTNLSGVGDLSQKQPDGAFAREATVWQRNLDKLGQKGWELIAVHGVPNQPIYYLKRPKEIRDK